MTLSKAEVEQAKAALELLKRYDEERIKFYRPCSDKHLAFHKSNKPIRWVFGPNQCGKTIMGLTETVFHACFKAHPFTKVPNLFPGRHRIFTDSFKKAEEHIIPLLKEWVPKKWLINGSWSDSYNDRYHMLRSHNGTYIDILTYDQDYAVSESVTLDTIWADEEMPKAFYSGSLPRLLARKGQMWMTVTPLHKMTWALPMWNKTDDPDIDVFKLGFNDNPHLDEERKRMMVANCPEEEKAARLNGEFLEFSGLVYKELDPQVHFINESKQPDSAYWPVICAVDPHQRKGTFVVWAYVTPNDEVVFFDELHVKGDVETAIQAIHAKESQHKARTLLRLIDPAADKQIQGYGSSHTTLDEFAEHGMTFSLADNSKAGYNAVHEFLKYDRSQKVSALNHPSCYFTKDAPETWRTMSNLLWDEYKFGRETRDPKETIKDFEKDFPDCVRYVLAMRPSNKFSSEPVNVQMRTTFTQDY